MHQIKIKKSVLKDLEKINEPFFSKIKESIISLANNPKPEGYKNIIVLRLKYKKLN